MNGIGPSRVLTEASGAVMVIKLNRPESRNAIDAETGDLLRRAVDQFEADPSQH